ncbi:hypothetical protein TCA2_5326 [Paenibacillus sp. TCA20]|nr:hypothetical protein TCA2_5326 [Paenibacillus sp. TCA20]
MQFKPRIRVLDTAGRAGSRGQNGRTSEKSDHIQSRKDASSKKLKEGFIPTVRKIENAW